MDQTRKFMGGFKKNIVENSLVAITLLKDLIYLVNDRQIEMKCFFKNIYILYNLHKNNNRQLSIMHPSSQTVMLVCIQYRRHLSVQHIVWFSKDIMDCLYKIQFTIPFTCEHKKACKYLNLKITTSNLKIDKLSACRIFHTVVLDDPFDDPPGLSAHIPDQSPQLTREQLDVSIMLHDKHFFRYEHK